MNCSGEKKFTEWWDFNWSVRMVVINIDKDGVRSSRMGIGHQLKGDYEQGRRGGKGQCLSQRHSGLQRALLPFCIELHTISGLF